MNNNDVDILRQLRNDYSIGAVSVLVGAGFSKNLYSESPLWNTLLEDIILKYHKEEICDFLKTKEHKDNELKKAKGFNDAINYIIEKYGGLELTEEYVKRRNYGHEAIDMYIEKRIPIIKEHDGKLYVYIDNNKKNEVEKDCLVAHNGLLDCDKFRNIYTTNYDNFIEAVNQYLSVSNNDNSLQVIDNSVRLSDSLTKRCIIKIHGSYSANDYFYNFDNDNHHKYIITKNDYETYQKRHEAFSVLMRIYMLQGKFCLIGFSGSDPNYLYWLQWMNDIISQSNENGTKVYIIQIKKEENDDERDLFYKTHHVDTIYLRDSKVLQEIFGEEYLKETIQEKIIPDNKIFAAFFNYLHQTSSLIEEKVNKISTSESKVNYYRLWDDLNAKINKNQDCSKVLQIIKDEKQKQIVHKYRSSQYRTIESLINKKTEWTSNDQTAFSLALDDCGLLPSYFRNCLKHAANITETSLWHRLEEREKTLSTNYITDFLDIEKEQDAVIYEYLVRTVINLDFKNATIIVDTWKPNNNWIVQKSMLSGLFATNKEESIQNLDFFISNEKDERITYMAKLTANVLYSEFPSHYSMDYYSYYRDENVLEILHYISNQVRNKKADLKPFGWNGHTYYFGSDNSQYEESLRLLQTLLNTGFLTSYKYYIIVNKERWYDVFVNIFEYYPMPCLFYTLLYNDTHLLCRCAQHYIYSDNLANVISPMLIKILDCIGNKFTPLHIACSMMTFCSEFYIAVDEEVWFDKFNENIFIPHVNNNEANNYYMESSRLNILKALKFINNKNHVTKLFKEYIASDNHSKDLDNLILSQLSLKYLDEKDADILNYINKIIEKHPLSESIEILYVLFYHNKLTTKQIERINNQTKVEDLEFAKGNPIIIMELLNLLKKQELQDSLKTQILCLNIWDCGIQGNSRTQPESFVRFSALPSNIKWNEDENRIILSNMIMNLSLIENYLKKNNSDYFLKISYIDLLEEMEKYLSTIYKDDKNILNHIKNIKDLDLGFSDVLNGLSSQDADDVYNAIWQLNKYLHVDGLFNHIQEIELIIDRILLKNIKRMNFVLNEISHLLNNFQDEMINLFNKKILLILETYKGYDYREMELIVPAANHDLHNIALSMTQYMEKGNAVDYWINDKMANRFYTSNV